MECPGRGLAGGAGGPGSGDTDRAGDLAAAERWSTTSALQRESLPRLHQEQEDLIAARLLIAQGKTEEALRLLEGWQVEAHEMGRTRREVESLVLEYDNDS